MKNGFTLTRSGNRDDYAGAPRNYYRLDRASIPPLGDAIHLDPGGAAEAAQPLQQAGAPPSFHYAVHRPGLRRPAPALAMQRFDGGAPRLPQQQPADLRRWWQEAYGAQLSRFAGFLSRVTCNNTQHMQAGRGRHWSTRSRASLQIG